MNSLLLFLNSDIHDSCNDGSTIPKQLKLRIIALVKYVKLNIPAFSILLENIEINTFEDYKLFPTIDKNNFINKFPIASRCRNGQLNSLEMIHVSSGSSGSPTFWGRSIADELAIAIRFEQIFSQFDAMNKNTLAVVAFPMGSWVGGLFTTFCIRYITQKGYKITLVTPGNNIDEILRVTTQLAPLFHQTVMLGYPPFVKTVIDKGVDLKAFNLKFILAGEVFSEEWREILASRAGVSNPSTDIISIYGTADAGVLASETECSILIRKFLSSNPEISKSLFKLDRIPSLMQYDPLCRYLELLDDDTLALTTLPLIRNNEDMNTAFASQSMPMIKYSIGDFGNIISFDSMLDFLKNHGFNTDLIKNSRKMPFVWVFGRSFWTLSFFGANVYVENIMVGLEQSMVSDFVTGKFVMSIENETLIVYVELSLNSTDLDNNYEFLIQKSILTQLLRLNSEFKNYVPTPKIVLCEYGDKKLFPVGVKHSYVMY